MQAGGDKKNKKGIDQNRCLTETLNTLSDRNLSRFWLHVGPEPCFMSGPGTHIKVSDVGGKQPQGRRIQIFDRGNAQNFEIDGGQKKSRRLRRS